MGGGKHAQRNDRRSKRAAKRAVQEPATQDFVDLIDPEELDEFDCTYGLGDGDRITQRLVSHRGRVVRFAFMHDTLTDNRWRPVARYDTCHGVAHVHRFDRHGDEFPVRHYHAVTNVDDVERALDHAEQAVVDEWEENKRRWNR